MSRTLIMASDELSAHDWAEVRRQARRRLARQAGIFADVVVNRKTITQSQKDEVVALLRACEKELIDAAAAVSRLPPQPIEHEVRLTRERVKAAIVAAVDRMAKYHDERYIPIGDFLDDALEYALDAAVATDAVLRAEDALLAEVLTLRRAVQDSAAFINNEQVQAARLPPAPAPSLTEDNRTRWLTGHQERGHTITLRRCYDECSCGTMYWRDLPADLAHLEGTAWEPVPLPAPAPAPQLSRDATDEEAEAAGARMIEKHRGLLEKLAARDREVAPAQAPQREEEKEAPMELTVADINEINRRLSAGLDYGSGNADPDAIKAVADLQWKLVFLGQQIEQAGKRRVPVPAPAPAWQPMCHACGHLQTVHSGRPDGENDACTVCDCPRLHTLITVNADAGRELVMTTSLQRFYNLTTWLLSEAPSGVLSDGASLGYHHAMRAVTALRDELRRDRLVEHDEGFWHLGQKKAAPTHGQPLPPPPASKE